MRDRSGRFVLPSGGGHRRAGNFQIDGLGVPAGALAVEYVPVDAIGNIGSAYTVNRDVVAVDAGPNAPVASVLQVGSKVLSEVVADDGSKSFGSGWTVTLFSIWRTAAAIPALTSMSWLVH